MRIYGISVSDENEAAIDDIEELAVNSQVEKLQLDATKIEQTPNTTSTTPPPSTDKLTDNQIDEKPAQPPTSTMNDLSFSFLNNLFSVISKNINLDFLFSQIESEELNPSFNSKPTKSTMIASSNLDTRQSQSDISDQQELIIRHKRRAQTIQIDFYKIICASDRFVDTQILNCCQCLAKFKKAATTQHGINTYNWSNDKCGYYFLMSTSNSDSLLFNYLRNMKFTLLHDPVNDEDAENEQTYFKIAINKIEYFISNKWLEERSDYFELKQIQEASKPTDNQSETMTENLNLTSEKTINAEQTTTPAMEEMNTREENLDATTIGPPKESENETVADVVNIEESLEELNEPGIQTIQQMPANTTTDGENSKNTNSSPITNSSPLTANGKEALFMRLNNRVKILELNMSLSSQYLEKLSQHYR